MSRREQKERGREGEREGERKRFKCNSGIKNYGLLSLSDGRDIDTIKKLFSGGLFMLLNDIKNVLIEFYTFMGQIKC